MVKNGSVVFWGLLSICSFLAWSAQAQTPTADQLKAMKALYDKPRSAWDPDPIDKNPSKPKEYAPRSGKILWISLHSTEADPDGKATLASGPSQKDLEQKSINGSQSEHLKKGWGDIAYHYLIGPSGTIYEGRDLMRLPASGTTYAPSSVWQKKDSHKANGQLTNPPNESGKPGAVEGHLTVSLVGDFRDKSEKKGSQYPEFTPTEPAQDALVKLVAQLLVINGLTINDIAVHRELAGSNCPGGTYYELIRGDQKRPGGMGPLMQKIEAEYKRLKH